MFFANFIIYSWLMCSKTVSWTVQINLIEIGRQWESSSSLSINSSIKWQTNDFICEFTVQTTEHTIASYESSDFTWNILTASIWWTLVYLLAIFTAGMFWFERVEKVAKWFQW
jgi:hypothetical protein